MISVIIPSYNRGRLIRKTIDSILQQSYKDVEIIIVDDASDESYLSETRESLGGLENVNLVSNSTNQGAGLSRKTGFQMASGKYVVFIDDDDFYCDDTFFSSAVEIMEQDDSISFVTGSSYDYFLETQQTQERTLNISGKVSAHEYLENFQFNYAKPDFFASIFRKDVLSDAIVNDIEMVNDSVVHMFALLNGENVFVLDSYVGNYVKHSGNISFNLKCDFIIENMVEKYKVKQRMEKNFSSSVIKKWWRGQAFVTATYYSYSNPSARDMSRLLAWLLKHCDGDGGYMLKTMLVLELKIIKRKLIR